MTIGTQIAAYIAAASQLSGIPLDVLAAQMVAERGWSILEPSGWPANNNPGDISWRGEGVPTGADELWFDGVVGVLSNGVVVYDTPELGATAYGLLLRDPPTSLGLPSHAFAGQSISQACVTLAKSHFSANNYHATAANPGGDLWAICNMSELIPLTAAARALLFPTSSGSSTSPSPSPSPSPSASPSAQPAPAPSSRTELVTVRPGMTIWALAQEFRTTVNAINAANDLTWESDRTLPIGRVLKIPVG